MAGIGVEGSTGALGVEGSTGASSQVGGLGLGGKPCRALLAAWGDDVCCMPVAHRKLVWCPRQSKHAAERQLAALKPAV